MKAVNVMKTENVAAENVTEKQRTRSRRGRHIVWILFTALVFLFCSGCRTAKAPPEQTIVCFGDSLTAGKGALPHDAYPAVLQKKVTARVINAGVSGDTVGDALKRVERDVLAHNPDIVIVELGANDFLEAKHSSIDMDALYKKYAQLLGKIAGGRRKIYLAKFYNSSIAEAFAGNDRERHAAFEAAFASLAASCDAEIIDDIWGGIWGKAEFMSDDLHPNGRGYRIMAEQYFAALEPHLAEQGLLK